MSLNKTQRRKLVFWELNSSWGNRLNIQINNLYQILDWWERKQHSQEGEIVQVLGLTAQMPFEWESISYGDIWGKGISGKWIHWDTFGSRPSLCKEEQRGHEGWIFLFTINFLLYSFITIWHNVYYIFIFCLSLLECKLGKWGFHFAHCWNIVCAHKNFEEMNPWVIQKPRSVEAIHLL